MANAYQLRLTPDLQDLNPILVGVSTASMDNGKDPDPHSYTLIHYVTSGRGKVYARGLQYDVHTGQAFLMLPGESVSYEADPEDPWAFRWVGFTGRLAHQFDQLSPVFDVPQEVLAIMCDLSDPETPNNILGYRVAAELMLLHAMLLTPDKKKPDYVQMVMDHVNNYSTKKLSVANIAASLGLNRSYLSDLFKKKTGLSIRRYILKTRLETSKRHLLHGASVKEAALASGFTDVSNFAKLFTREVGTTPTQFRKNARNSMETFQKHR